VNYPGRLLGAWAAEGRNFIPPHLSHPYDLASGIYTSASAYLYLCLSHPSSNMGVKYGL
jgi:hypothetical protein